MTASGSAPPSLPVKQLKEAFLSATEQGTLGGSSVLSELARLARRCIPGSSVAGKIVAYTLSKFFASMAKDRDERKVTVHEDTEFLRNAHQPVVNAIEFLENPRDVHAAAAVASTLIDIEHRMTP